MKLGRKGGASAPPPNTPYGEEALAPEVGRLQGLKADISSGPQAAGLKPRPSAGLSRELSKESRSASDELRNKKLRARFLAALGMTTNSTVVPIDAVLLGTRHLTLGTFLLLPQRRERIDLGGAARGKVAGQKRYSCEQHRDS